MFIQEGRRGPRYAERRALPRRRGRVPERGRLRRSGIRQAGRQSLSLPVHHQRRAPQMGARAARGSAIRDDRRWLADEIEGTRHDIVRTQRRLLTGEPLLIWGEYGDDALRVRNTATLIEALDTLHELAQEQPRMLRLWTAADDQVVAVANDDHVCAVRRRVAGWLCDVVRRDQARPIRSTVIDHDGRTLRCRGRRLHPVVRARAMRCSTSSSTATSGRRYEVEGRIPSLLLMMGDVDRKAALETRARATASGSTRSSLPRNDAGPARGRARRDDDAGRGRRAVGPSELSAWAKRLIEMLALARADRARAVTHNLDEISYQLGGLLQAHGDRRRALARYRGLARERDRRRARHQDAVRDRWRSAGRAATLSRVISRSTKW